LPVASYPLSVPDEAADDRVQLARQPPFPNWKLATEN